MTRFAVTNRERLLKIVCGLSVIAILIAKILLIWRININWDEFYFLSHVYSLARGDLDLLMQTAYTHLFVWATWREADEIVEIRLLRLSMWPLLALSCFLLYRLARHWASPVGAWFAVFAFVTSWPVLKHGISFRADSLLLPLTLAAFVLATGGSDGPTRLRRDAGAGIVFGAAIAVSIKAALSLPALLVLFLVEARHRRSGSSAAAHVMLWRLATIALAAALTAAAIVALHSAFVTAAAQSPGSVANLALRGTLLEVPWVPRWVQFRQLVATDWLLWLLLASGAVAAIIRRRYGAAACALSLLPVLFYRNAYAYYYVIMLAPACAVVAVGVDEARTLAARNGRAGAGAAAIAAVFLVLAHNAWGHLMTLRFDEQAGQRAVVTAVHRIFPTPVPYIDHGGMIASFHKVNFFMSTWGVENYLRRGEDFMPEVIGRHCPPLLLVNHPVLKPGALLFRELRAGDRALLESRYVPYWGPIRLAGAAAEVQPGEVAGLRVPCTGRYRLSTSAPVLLDGRAYVDGDVLELAGERDYRLEPADPISSGVAVTVRWADVREPPIAPPPRKPIYAPL